VFFGNLALPNNLEGVAWYVREVLPHLQVSGMKTVIAGNTMRGRARRELAELERVARTNAVEWLEDVGDPSAVYSNGRVFVNPVRRGAGVNLKTLDAIKAGLAVVSTPRGVEGSGLRDGEHCMVRQDAREFAHAVGLLWENEALRRDMVQRAQAFVREEYDQRKHLQRLLSRLAAAT
jgi:glycosyltransferase involved in cell wall biosynthesis